MDIWLVEPNDITPTSVYDVAMGGKLDSDFMKTLDENRRRNHVQNHILVVGSLITTEDVKEIGIRGATFSAFIVDFVKTRGIMKEEDMSVTPFFDILAQLEKNAIERGLDKFPLSGLSSFKDFDQYTMEDFEAMFAPVWAIYPYRDEGYIRYLGLHEEYYSFCQWSMEWNINSSAVTCELAR